MKKYTSKPQKNKQKFPCLKVSLKLKNGLGKTISYRTSKTKRIFAIVRQENFSEAILKVAYGVGFYNNGVYYNKKSLLTALKAFTERSSRL